MNEREKKIIVWSDDDPAMHEVAKLLLEPEGYEVHCVATTAETIGLVKRLRPGLVVTNFWKALEHDSGLGIAEALKTDALSANIPLLLCTACAIDTPAVQWPFDDLLPKPFTQNECLETIRRLLKE
jgi:CheY-like chemotaxis protein